MSLDSTYQQITSLSETKGPKVAYRMAQIFDLSIQKGNRCFRGNVRDTIDMISVNSPNYFGIVDSQSWLSAQQLLMQYWKELGESTVEEWQQFRTSLDLQPLPTPETFRVMQNIRSYVKQERLEGWLFGSTAESNEPSREGDAYTRIAERR